MTTLFGVAIMDRLWSVFTAEAKGSIDWHGPTEKLEASRGQPETVRVFRCNSGDLSLYIEVLTPEAGELLLRLAFELRGPDGERRVEIAGRALASLLNGLQSVIVQLVQMAEPAEPLEGDPRGEETLLMLAHWLQPQRSCSSIHSAIQAALR